MKSFKEFMVEAHKKEKATVFFAHYKSKDPKHNIEAHKKPVEFFAHYKLNDPKHNIEDKKLKENFDHYLGKLYKDPSIIQSKDKPIKSSDSAKSMEHHKKIKFTRTYESGPAVPISERDAVQSYTHESKELNDALHSGKKIKDRYMNDKIDQLDKVTNHPENKLTGRAVTYSGVSPKFGKKLSAVKPGKTVKSRAYISSTIKPDVAHDFAAQHDEKAPQHHIIQFHLPKGYSKGRYINHASVNRGEGEFLLARNQNFRKIRTQHIDGGEGKPKFIVHHVEPIDESSG